MLRSVIVLVLFSMACIHADTLILKNGLKLQGIYKGGTEEKVKFETSGAVQELAVSEIESISFSRETETAASIPPEAEIVATPQVAAAGKTIPAGTKMMIKILDPISTANNAAGSKFRAALEKDIVVNGQVVAARDSEVYGTVLESIGGRRIGVKRIIITFDELIIDGKQIAIKTDDVGAEGGAGGAARKVGAGAIIGSASGNAGKGAAIGAGVALLGGGTHIQVPANSLVEVFLKETVVFP